MNSSKFVFVILSILISVSTFWIGMTVARMIRLNALNATSDPKDLHLTYNLNNNKMNMNLTFLRDIGENIKFNLDVLLKVKGKYTRLGKVMNLNFCDTLQHVSKDSLLNFVFEDIRSLNMTCPLRKKTYYMKDYTLHEKSLPPSAPNGEYRFSVNFVKVAEKKRILLLGFILDTAFEK